MDEIMVSPSLSALWEGSVGGKAKSRVRFGCLVCCSLSTRLGPCLYFFFSHFLDEGRLGGLRTEIMQTWPNSRLLRKEERVAGSILTIWLAEAARLFIGDAAGSFFALLGPFFGTGFWQEVLLLNFTFVILTIEKKCLSVSLNCPCWGAQHPGTCRGDDWVISFKYV